MKLFSELTRSEMQKERLVFTYSLVATALGFFIGLYVNSYFEEQQQRRAFESLKKMMRPELLNRIDNVIVFKALTKDEITEILELQLSNLERRLVRHGIGLKVKSSAKKYLAEHGYDVKNGVRPLRRLLQETLEDNISQGLLDGTYQKGNMVQVSAKNDGLVYKAIKE